MRTRCLEFVAGRNESQSKVKVLTRARHHQQQEGRWRRSRLTQEHLDFLTAPATLRDWAGTTLAERRCLFHRRHPEIKISKYHLRLTYYLAGIKKKQISIRKWVTPAHKKRIQEEARQARRELDHYEAEGRRIIYVDELCTTKSTI